MMCQVHTGPYVSLLTPGETDYTNYTACRTRKATTYIYSIYHYAYARQTQVIGEKKQRKEKNIKERKEERRKRGPYRSIRLITHAWRNRLPHKKGSHEYILRSIYSVYITCSIYHYAYTRQTQVLWRKETKKRKKVKERKEKRRKRNEKKKRKKKRKKRKRQAKQEKTRQEEEAREGSEKKRNKKEKNKVRTT